MVKYFRPNSIGYLQSENCQWNVTRRYYKMLFLIKNSDQWTAFEINFSYLLNFTTFVVLHYSQKYKMTFCNKFWLTSYSIQYYYTSNVLIIMMQWTLWFSNLWFCIYSHFLIILEQWTIFNMMKCCVVHALVL